VILAVGLMLATIPFSQSRGGVLATRRGGGGGVTLARPAAQIGLGSVIRLLEDGHALVECFAPPAAGGAGCNLLPACRLRARLRSAEEAFLTDLDRSSLAEIAVTSLPVAA
jgi:Rrf2 family nitric oxide-sensitive transcriptional repressor